MSDSAQQAKAQKKAYDEACKRVLSERGIMGSYPEGLHGRIQGL